MRPSRTPAAMLAHYQPARFTSLLLFCSSALVLNAVSLTDAVSEISLRNPRDSCAAKYYSAVSGMDSSQRLLLQALLTGMGDAVRRNDASAADRYHRRLALIAPHFATNPSVSEALERLHSAGARWLATDAAEHYAAEQQVLEDIQRVMDFI
jgi:hypothetical protein